LTNQELIQRIRACRLADLSDGMDAIGLVNTGTMSSEMRPLRPGIRMAGLAYTVKLIPTQKAVKVCSTYEEYQKELGEWCQETYAFLEGLRDGQGKDKVVVIDMDGYPGGIWGSECGMNAAKNGVVGVVIDGGCRDSYECNLEKLAIWCTARTFNHVYGRLESGGVNVPVECAGVVVHPGDIVCGDDDGVLVIPRELAEQVVVFAEGILKADQKVRAQHYKDLGYEYDETLGEFGAETETRDDE
jgi:4-hydroxy-4-methyl-2-oxoglutarate aldolase